MGQAVVDLPNPLEAPPPATMSGTDDLLAQLAGDEIDRLLAEADADRPAPSPPVAVAAPGAQDPALNSVPTEIAPAPVANPAPAAVAAPAPVTAEAVAPAVSAALPTETDDELDALLNQLNESPPVAAPIPTSESAAPDAAPKSLTDQVPQVLAQFGTEPAAAATPTAPESVEAVMSTAERDALNLSTLPAETEAAEQQDAATATIAAEAEALSAEPSGRLRPAIRILEWINAPVASVPDAMRDTLGKVAILTLVNSIAVLIYVLFMRH